MTEIGSVWKRARCVFGIGRHSELLSSKRPLSAYRAERRFAKNYCKQVGFYPFRGPDASFYANQILPEGADDQNPAACSQTIWMCVHLTSKFTGRYYHRSKQTLGRSFLAMARVGLPWEFRILECFFLA